ncbi:hypothetical protein GCM10011351_00320 [Paraliobacillus quinghaiensis]|uniref:Uncharacterized protein n=1 Tax=Paraliobacillus quinghaiensis TaxID=470815 RepID=A0A917WPB1_9BACI|nr:hypothetical protein [Paraliobacillus quinghaiensis]GGM18494.1 hypothetical protein GCM10011351_00320 [Paraliobacillus quinghaiensis]
MKKNLITILALIIFGVGIFLIYDQLNRTSYQNVMSDMIDESEQIIEITIEDKRNYIETTIEDKELFDDIIEKPKEMQLRKQNDLPSMDYLIIIHTNKRDYDIGLGKTGIHFGYAGTYSVVGENILYNNINQIKF